MLYDDGKIACDDSELLIRRYYPRGSKRVPYTSIRSVKRIPIRVRRWRLWGSGDFRHWWNLDLRLTRKGEAGTSLPGAGSTRPSPRTTWTPSSASSTSTSGGGGLTLGVSR
jgi:hypothetical protein